MPGAGQQGLGRPTRDAALRPSMAGQGPTFPLHRLVWANRHRELEAALHSRQVRPLAEVRNLLCNPPAPSLVRSRFLYL